MNKVIIITDHKNTFIDAVSTTTDLRKWALNWIENDDQGIEFWNIGTLDVNESEIILWGDNGSIWLNFKTIELC